MSFLKGLRARMPVSVARRGIATAALLCSVGTASMYAQSDRGTVSGVVKDPSGAAVPGAKLKLRDLDSNASYSGVSTGTGNYTISSVPAGKYELTVEMKGFKTFVQSGISVDVAQTASADVALQVGSQDEIVSVTSDAPIIQTENSEQSTTISREQLNTLPINFAGNQAIRDPLAFSKLTPGVYQSGQTGIRVNGLPSTSFKITLEGQDITNANLADREDENHPSVEALQEFTLQTSTFAAEFGQVGGGLFNFTARSGTNRLHGTAYGYFENEALNAQQKFAFNSAGQHIPVLAKNRQFDYGFAVGGPVIIPKLYDGRNKTFFFLNWEWYRQDNAAGITLTLPTARMRTGDFGEILTGRQLGTDPLGRPIYENTIYNPATTRTVNGQVVRDPFPNNVITTPLDPIATKVQALVPAPTSTALVNNYSTLLVVPKRQDIPSLKIDQAITQKLKVSFFYSVYNLSFISGPDSLPEPLTGRRDQPVYSKTSRGNVDYTITPNLLLHLGAGYIRDHNVDSAPPGVTNVDASTYGFKGQAGLGFPTLGFGTSSYGGYANSASGNNFGPTNRNLYWPDKATGIGNITWVHGNHSYKAGGEYKLDLYTVTSATKQAGSYGFSANETALPYLNTTSLTSGSTQGTIGFSWASFLLGQVDSGSIGNAISQRFRRPSYSMFVQDTWRATPRLTVDYGIRWDFTGVLKEAEGRTSGFSPTRANPNAGNLPGALVFDQFGTGRCNCNFLQSYPYAIGPRVGFAYKASEKIVFRGGFGTAYGQPASMNYAGTNYTVAGVGFNTINFSPPSFGLPTTTLATGLVYPAAALTNASLDPGLGVSAGSISSPLSPYFDSNGNRPARIQSFSFGLQQQLTANTAIEIAYVGNRAIWLTSGDSSNLGIKQLNAVSAGRLKSFGLDVTNPADFALLTTPLKNQTRFAAPYAGFPTSQTVAQALRPYPQYGTIYTEYSPAGKSWYDALQTKVTRRMSHGLEALVTYTWSKELDEGTDTERGRGAQINDALNPASNKFLTSTYQPHRFSAAFTYVVPLPASLNSNWFTREALGGWTFGGILRYSNGLLLRTPGSNGPAVAGLSNTGLGSALFRGTFANRAPATPLFKVNPNARSINPNTTQFQNDAAWSNAPLGQFSYTPPYMNDYRWQRQPDEELSIAKRFAVPMPGKETANFQVRAEFFDVFNRGFLPTPGQTNFQTINTSNSSFGRIVLNSNGVTGRQGQIVARFEF